MNKDTQHNEGGAVELRSEKVRNIVGQIPPLLIRQGITIIGITLLILSSMSILIPYRKTIPVKITWCTIPSINMLYTQHIGIFILDSLLKYKKGDSLHRNKKMIKKGQKIGYILHENRISTITSPTNGILVLRTFDKTLLDKHSLIGIVIPSHQKKIYASCEIEQSLEKEIYKGQNIIIHLANNRNITASVREILSTDTQHVKLSILIVNTNELRNVSINESCIGNIIVEERSLLNWLIRKIKL